MADVSRPVTADYLEKILRRGPLSEGAQVALLGLPSQVQSWPVYRDIVREGEQTRSCCLVLDGVVSRYKSLRNGGRQIVSFHLAGDMVDLQSCLLKISDHGIRPHTPVTLALIPFEPLLRAAAEFPDLARALWFDTLVDAAIFREWTLNVGRRTARERLAHLLLEFSKRMASAGLSDGERFVLPVTQADLADATGLSPVHLNRSLQSLRVAGFIRTLGKQIEIVDRAKMVMESGFSTNYLHPEGPRQIASLD